MQIKFSGKTKHSNSKGIKCQPNGIKCDFNVTPIKRDSNVTLESNASQMELSENIKYPCWSTFFIVAAFLTNISALTLAPEIPVTLLHPLALG